MDGAGPVGHSPLGSNEDDDDGDEEKDQEVSTEKEKEYVERLKASSPMPFSIAGPGGGKAKWTFRRQGYNDEGNPDHSILVLSHGSALGGFKCEALARTQE